jgi:hypothetical protein
MAGIDCLHTCDYFLGNYIMCNIHSWRNECIHVELGTLFSVVRQIAENLAHANIGGCNRAMYSGELCIHHQPIKAEKRKSDRCQGFGRVLGVEERVRLDSAVCAMESQRQ